MTFSERISQRRHTKNPIDEPAHAQGKFDRIDDLGSSMTRLKTMGVPKSTVEPLCHAVSEHAVLLKLHHFRPMAKPYTERPIPEIQNIPFFPVLWPRIPYDPERKLITESLSRGT